MYSSIPWGGGWREKPNAWLQNTTSEKDLGIAVDLELNMSQLCDVAAKKANAILVCINRSIVSIAHQLLVPLYSALVLSIVSSSGHHTLRRMPTNWNKFRGGQQG